MMMRTRAPSPMYMSLHLPEIRGRESRVDECLGREDPLDERAHPRAVDAPGPQAGVHEQRLQLGG